MYTKFQCCFGWGCPLNLATERLQKEPQKCQIFVGYTLENEGKTCF